MNRKHRKTLESVFADPVRANIVWKDIEALFIALGAEISEGRGSRIRVVLHGVKAIFHRPHPRKEANKGMVKSVRRFLSEAGIKP
ncbi:MAG TPA: type II toxin-antitoxin system HicA family toxin [Chloroflexi bacterium]|nr:type II toxin-antitoxin system HicA family toxin [Chloroflexota bacterium]